MDDQSVGDFADYLRRIELIPGWKYASRSGSYLVGQGSVSSGGFEQCYNAQAGVDANTMLVVATTLTQVPNDKQQVQLMLKVLQEQEAKLGTASTLIADTGYCSENNVKVCEEAKLTPLIAVARQDHYPHWRERFTEPAPLQEMPRRCKR